MRIAAFLLFGLLCTAFALPTLEDTPSIDENEDIEMTTAPTFSLARGATVDNFKCQSYLNQELFVSYTGVIPRGSQIQVYDRKGEIASSGEAICGAWIDIKQGLLKAGNCASRGRVDIARLLWYIETPGVYTVYYQELYNVRLGYTRDPGVRLGTVTVRTCNARSSAESSEEEEDLDVSTDLDMMVTPVFKVPQHPIRNFACPDYVSQHFVISWTGTIPRGSALLVYNSKGEFVTTPEQVCGWFDLSQGKLCPTTGTVDLAGQLSYIGLPGVYNIFYQELYDPVNKYTRSPGVKIGTATITTCKLEEETEEKKEEKKATTPTTNGNLKVGSSAESDENNSVTSSSSSSSSSSSAACSARNGLCTASQNCVGTYFTDPLGCAAGTVCCDGKIRQQL